MTFDQPQRDKMMKAAPAKKQFHFSGDGIYHNMMVLADDLDDATKQWLEKRQLIDAPASQSTPDAKEEPADAVQ